jgi:hypothetical protein
VEFYIETVQHRLELTPCDLVRIMLPAGYERRPALLPDCRAEENFYRLRQAWGTRVNIDGAA